MRRAAELLGRILREEWGVGGYVTSDCWAIMDIVSTHRAAGSVAEAAALAAEAARKSIVLLKNDGGLLTLRSNVGTVAVIGPNADDAEILVANYNGFASDPITPLRGIRDKVAPGARVIHARGSALADELPHLVPIPASALRPAATEGRGVTLSGGVAAEGRSPGLRAEYFASPDLSGTPVAVRTGPAVDFRWWGDVPMPGLGQAGSARAGRGSSSRRSPAGMPWEGRDWAISGCTWGIRSRPRSRASTRSTPRGRNSSWRPDGRSLSA